jgi:hypothetical protein
VRIGCVDALDIYVYEDRQIGTDANARFEKPYPLEPSVGCDWIAVSGKIIKPEESDTFEPDFISDSPETTFTAAPQTNRRQQLDSEGIVSASKHIFSYELQLYYQTSIKHLLSGEADKRERMLRDLKCLQCLETLLPHYIRFCFSLMKNNPWQFDRLYICVSVARALVQNDDLGIEIYLQHFISLAESLLLSAKVVTRDLAERFLLRDYAVDVLRLVMDKAAANYPMIEPKVVAQLVSVLRDKTMVFSQKYGALRGLISFGLDTLSGFLLPILPQLVEDTLELIAERNGRAHEIASRMYEASVEAAGFCLHNDTYFMTATGRYPYSAKTMRWGQDPGIYRGIIDTFGADLITYYVDEDCLLSI